MELAMHRTLAVCIALSIALLNPAPAGAAGIGAVPVVTGLDFPAAFTFAPDGRIFYTNTYTGEIHIYDPSNGSDSLFYTLTGDTGVQGVLGLVLMPTYPTQPYLFAHVTRTVLGALVDQIVRIRDNGGMGTQPRVITTAAGCCSGRTASSTWSRETKPTRRTHRIWAGRSARCCV
jgi:hypothetical protein